MKKKTTLLFALLCASVMAFAINWDDYSWLGNGGVAASYNDTYKAAVTPALPSGSFINNMQTYGGYASIHMAMPSDLMTVSLDGSAYSKAGAAIFPHLDAFTAQETEFTVTCLGTTYTFTIYNKNGATTSATETSDLTRTSDAALVLDPTATSPITFSTSSTGAVTYKSSNNNVATVDNGVITAVAFGEAVITVEQEADDTYKKGSFEVSVTVNMAKQASGMGFGTLHMEDVDLYDWVGNFAGSNACGKVDLYVVTWGNNVLYKAIAKEGKYFDPGQYYFCQLRTWKTDLTDIAEHWARTHSEDNTIRYMTTDQTENAPGLAKYGDEIKLTTYMVLNGCGARTMKTVSYTRDYINNINVSDVTAPVLGAATVTPGADDITVSFAEVTSEPVFYMIEDAEHNKRYFSMVPSFVLPKDGSGITYNYSCYAIDFNGNKSVAQPAEVTMPFSVLSNLALNKSAYSATNAGAEYIPATAVDGKLNTRWSPGGVANAADAWWAIDLGAVYNLSSLEMVWEGAYSDNFVIYGADNKPSSWNNISEYETTLVTNTVVPTVGNDKNNVYPVSGHARYLLFMPSHLANNGWGASFWEFRAFGTGVYDPSAGVDDEEPVISAATVTSKTHNTAVIALTASDNVGIIKVKAVDSSNGIDEDLIPSENSVTLTGLLEKTTYTLTLTAYDAANNVSAPFVMDAFETELDPTIPQVAAPVPDATGKDILPVYSDAFASILAHPFNLNGFEGTPMLIEKNIAGNKCAVYDVSSTKNFTWGMWNDGDNAIIAATGYSDPNDAGHKGIYASEMEKLHIDIWSLQACATIVIKINDGARTGGLTLSHNGEGWQGFDLSLSDFVAGANINNVRWMKFEAFNAVTGKAAIDNVYFWAPSTGMKTVSAASGNPTMGSAVVKQGTEEVSSVAENSEVTFIATANEGYVFVNWTNQGVEVSTDANYVTTITEATNLVANFDYVRTAYCHTPILANDNVRTMYLSCSKVGENTYQIRVDGTAEAPIGSRYNYDFAINGTGVTYNVSNWTTDNTGYGYAQVTFTATNLSAINMPNKYLCFNKQGGGLIEFGTNIPAANTIAWNSTCADATAPVFVKAEGAVLTETSVRLTLQATDNWEGNLTYTIARAGAEPIISNHMSGEEFAQDITGLTTGTEYDFTVTVSDGVNPTYTHIIITPVGDETKPVMGEASLASKTWNSAVINVAATDNKGVVAYYIVELDAEFVPSAGTITVEGLTPGTPYTFTIKAKDAAGNMSDNSAEVNFTTDAHLFAPATAPVAPTWPAAQVISFYSDAYTAPATWNFRAPWGGSTAYEQVSIAGNNVIHYSNLDFVGWIISAGEPYNALTMDKLHLDIWVENDCEIGIVPIYGGAGLSTDDNKRFKKQLTGQQWNSVDLVLATDYAGLNLSSIFQFKFDQATTNAFYLDNVYFYRTTELEDHAAPENVTGSMHSQSYYSVVLNVTATDDNGAVTYIIKNGEAQVASTSGASGATVQVKVDNLNPGQAYTFDVIAKDGSDNEADAISVNASTLAAPASAPVPTYPEGMVMSLYSDAYAPVVNVANYCEWWWEAPTVHTNHMLAEGDHVLFYDNNHQAGASFGWAWSGDNMINFAHYQKLHLSVYPSADGTIEIYPVVQPEAQFHKVSQDLVGGQWNEIVLDYTDKTFAPLNQIGFINFYNLGEFFVDNVYFYAEAEDFAFVDDADNAAVVAANDKRWINAILNRSLLANGEWFTLCLPFDMSDAQLTAAFGAGYTLTMMTGAEDRGSVIHLNFEDVHALEAGKAYLLRPAQDFHAGDAIPGVMLKNVDPAALKSANDYMEFQGTFSTTLLNQDNQRFVGPENLLYMPAAAGTNMKSFRCFFTIPAGPQQNNVMGKRAKIVFGPQTATDIDHVQSDQVQSTKVLRDGQLFILRDGRTYNAQGQLVK